MFFKCKLCETCFTYGYDPLVKFLLFRYITYTDRRLTRYQTVMTKVLLTDITHMYHFISVYFY